MLAQIEIEDIVRKTIRETLLTMGLNVTNPDDLLEYQKDQHHLRADRLRKENMVNAVLQHLVTMSASAVVTFIALTFFTH